MSPPKPKIEIQRQNRSSNKSNGVSKPEKTKSKTTDRFEYGNYNRYYGYRNVDGVADTRIEAFQDYKELFYNKEILDIGCNIGHVTYLIGRDLGAKTVLGIDIDNSLIQIARKNAKYYSCLTSPAVTGLLEKCDITTDKDRKETELTFPDEDRKDTRLKFPNNVSFLHSNYVLYHDDLLAKEEPRYDAILCLSITKWIHLNWGDEGLKRVFRRIFLQLRPNGVLVLEAQPFESYKKKKLSLKLRSNAEKIRLLPSMFENYLISEIGFKSCKTLTTPCHSSKGFQRPIQIFFKE